MRLLSQPLALMAQLTAGGYAVHCLMGLGDSQKDGQHLCSQVEEPRAGADQVGLTGFIQIPNEVQQDLIGQVFQASGRKTSASPLPPGRRQNAKACWHYGSTDVKL